MAYDYFYNDESEQYQFLQMPWLLIKDEQFKILSSDTKILYSLLLNRTSLSKKNGWFDEQGRVYLIYPIEEIKEDLNCGRDKAIKSMQELTKIGLVQTKRRGLGKPNLIYVKNFATSLKYQPKKAETPVDTLKSENPTSENRENRLLKVGKADSSNTNINNTYFNNIESTSESMSEPETKKLSTGKENDVTNDIEFIKSNKTVEKEKEPAIPNTDQSTETESSISKNADKSNSSAYDYNTYRRIVQENIEYSHYFTYKRANIDLIDELIDCMLDVICTKGDIVKINGEEKSRQMVINQYLKINSSDIEHILDRYKGQRHKITHLHAYLKTMLYTVKQENGFYYTNAVRVDGVV